MSKALYEPNTMRQLASSGYDTRQLQRRPAPKMDLFGAPYQTNIYFDMFSLGEDRDPTNWQWIDVNPAVNCPYSATFNNFRHDFDGVTANKTPADGDYFYCAARVGPSGNGDTQGGTNLVSFWAFAYTLLYGPDYGTIGCEFASLTEDSSGTVMAYEDATWFDSGQNTSAYNSVAKAGNQGGQHTFFITGFPGDPLTSFNTGSRKGDWGAGIFGFKFKVNGKHASSSGYKVAISSLYLTREDTNANSLG